MEVANMEELNKNLLPGYWNEQETDEGRMNILFSFWNFFKLEIGNDGTVNVKFISDPSETLNPFETKFGEGLEDLILDKCRINYERKG